MNLFIFSSVLRFYSNVGQSKYVNSKKSRNVVQQFILDVLYLSKHLGEAVFLIS